MASGGTHRVPYTLETTDFHDVLMQKGIISREQALISKGMTVDEANALLLNEAVQKEVVKAAKYHETTSELQEAKRHSIESKLEKAEDHARADEDEDDELLRELEEDEEAEAVLRSYRERRMQEMRAVASKRKYGELREIFRQDWMREVNDASTDGPVVINLYQDAIESTKVVDRVLEELAPLHRDVKFLRITSTQAIEGWPDANLPTIFLYRDGEMKVQMNAEKLCSQSGELSTASIVSALEEAGALPSRERRMTGRAAEE